MRAAWRDRSGETGEIRSDRGLRPKMAAVGAVAGLLGGVVSTGLMSPTAAHADVTISVPCTGSGGGSAGLISAIDRANTSGGGTIDLARACTYGLTTAHTLVPGIPGPTGLPITTTVTINGNDSTIQRSSGAAGPFRIFAVAGPNGNLTLNSLTIAKGRQFQSFVAGGGILNSGSLTLDHSTVSGNAVTNAPGGGISNLGNMTLNDSRVAGNFVVGTGNGGGIANSGPATLTGGKVSENSILVLGAGGGISNSQATLTLAKVKVEKNTAAAGGGLVNQGCSSTMRLESSTAIDSNTAKQGLGGGIATSGPLTIDRSTIMHNTATGDHGATGGGISNSASCGGGMAVSHSHITGNTASATGTRGDARGGGIWNSTPGATATLTHSSVSHNIADHLTPDVTATGGGIFNAAGVVMLNSTQVVGSDPNNCAPAGSVPGCRG